jgi:hypothetical protein
MVGKNSPWGKIDDYEKLAENVYFVHTPSHGGFMVHESVGLSEAARRQAEKIGPNYFFEEDCLASIVYYELNLSDKIHEDDIKRTLVRWCSDYVQEIGKSEEWARFSQK